MRKAMLLVLLMLSAPLASATDAPYEGDAELVVIPSGDGSLVMLTEDAFSIPANSTILDGEVVISTGAMGDGGTGTHWRAGDPSLNFSHGNLSSASITVFEDELTLGVNHTVGRLDDLEALTMRFQRYTPGGSADVWRMAEPSTFNGPFAMNYSARQAAGGLIPALGTDGALVAATLPEDPLPAGTHAWLTSDAASVPVTPNDWRLTMNHWYHLHHVNGSTGSGGAWLEISLDNGVTWTWVEPEGGYPANVSTTAPVPSGAPGPGFGVFGGANASGWVNSSFDLTPLHSTTATSLLHRFVVWTDPAGQVDRPGWYVDEVTISDAGSTPGAWFHGSLSGEYAADAHAHLSLPAQLNLSGGTTGAWMLRYWTDFDLEGGSWDHYKVRISADNLSWHRVSQAGGIPGPNGLTVGGRTIMDDSGGWVEVAHPFPASFTIPANGSIHVRFEVQTDQMPSSGYGANLDPPEGVFIDDLSITRTNGGTTTTVWQENLTTPAAGWHDRLPGGSYDQWMHLTDWGNNGPTETTWSFENAPRVAEGWVVDTPYGQSWSFGNVSNTSGWGPAAWPSGNVGAAMNLGWRHAANSWTHLISPRYHIPQGASARVAFDHFICTEPGWDGGALYTSVDNGTSWQIFGQDIPGFYDVQHWNNVQSPFHQQWVWDGSNQKGGGCQNNKSFTHVEGDLSAFHGQDVQLRFSFFSDDFIEMDGWYIDRVGVVVDWFETNGSWTSSPLQAPPGRHAPSVDVDVDLPPGAWLEVDILKGLGETAIELQESPTIHGEEQYRIRLRFGTTDHQLTPRVNGLHVGAVRILSAADATNGWTLDSGLSQDRMAGNITNPTLLTKRLTATPAYGSAPVTALSIDARAAGALFEARDNKGAILASGSLTNRTIQLSHPAVMVHLTIDLQPGGWVSRASFTGHLGLTMHNGSVDIGGDGIVDWTHSPDMTGDGFGWEVRYFNGFQAGYNLPAGATERDFALLVHAWDPVSWEEADGTQHSMVAGEIRAFDHYPMMINLSCSCVTHHLLGATYDLDITVSDLGPAMRQIQAAAINGSGPGTLIGTEVHIPIVVRADAGGVALDGHIQHAQRIVNRVAWVPPTTLVPDEEVTLVTEHSHLFDRDLLTSAILRLQSSGGVDIEIHIDDLSTAPVATQLLGADSFSLTEANVSALDDDGFRILWTLRPQWAFEDQDLIQVLAEAIEADGFTLGPGHGQIGGSNHQAMENDLEVVSWEVRDAEGRLLSNTWDARYPMHALAGSTLDVHGVVRFEGQAGHHPAVDAFRVALEVAGDHGIHQALGSSGAGGGFSAAIDLPLVPGNVTLSPGIIQVGPTGISAPGAQDASAGALSIEVRVDAAAPRVGPLMIHTPDGGQIADGNILSPNRMLPLWLEVEDAELLESFVDLRCWLESFDDLDGDGVADPDEYGHSNQFIGGAPRGQLRVDFPAFSLNGMADGDRVSCYVDGGDFAGHAFLGGGGPGFDADLATMTVETQQPTQVSLPSIQLDRHEDMALLQGVRHTFSFTVVDGNGITSLDAIELDLAGDGRGVVVFTPLDEAFIAIDGGHIVPLDARVEDLGDDAWGVELDIAIALTAPTEWQTGEWIPDLRIHEEGEMVSSGATDLAHLTWALDHRLRWVVDAVEDLTAPAMPAFDDRLNLQPGDAMRLDASVVHRETWAPLAIPLPTSDGVDLSILGGIQEHAVILQPEGAGFSTMLELSSSNWPGPLHDVRFGLRNVSRWNTSLPDLSFEIAIDDVAPRITFQSTSLVQLTSDHLTGQLVAFSIEDAGGMGEQAIELHWSYRRDGIDIAGAQGMMDMGLGVYSEGSWVYSAYADLTPVVGLNPGDMLLVWVEGSDLAGNPLKGTGTRDSPRVPALEVMHFTPGLTSVWVDPPNPEVGDMVRVDARISNLGNLPGQLSVALWAWEPQPAGGERIVPLQTRILNLDPGQGQLLSFEFEAWREGDLQVYLVLNEDEGTRLAVDVPPVREEGASLTFLERLFGDGPLALGLLVILCTALGFVGALLWLREEDGDEEEDDEEEEFDDWPEPPESFPDETPPPMPPGLEEEE